MEYLLAIDKNHPRKVATTPSAIRGAAADTSYAWGTDYAGRFVPLGIWPWKSPPVVLADLKPAATSREKRDHRTADGLLAYVTELENAFMTARNAVAEAVGGEADLITQGYTNQALQSANVELGRRVLRMVGNWASTGEKVAARVDDALRDLAKQRFQDDEDSFLVALQLPTFRPGETSTASDDDRTRSAAANAVYDVEIAKALKPLTPAERDVLLHGGELPAGLRDGRVLRAIFSVPRVMLPYDGEELSAIANIGFMTMHPKTATVSRILAEMLLQVQRELATALQEGGKRAYPDDPVEAFRRAQGGDWASQALEDGSMFAREAKERMTARLMLDAVGSELWATIATRSAKSNGVQVVGA
jgi:hypothetical protein